MKTTLNAIRACAPCASGWSELLAHLGKTSPDDEPLSLLTILDSNGLGDALWALRAVEGHDREKRLFAVWCARQVEHLLTDQRSRDALDVAERYARGRATREELDAAERYARGRATREELDAAADAAAYAAYAAAARAAAAAARAAAVAAYAADAAADAADVAQSAEFRRVCECVDAGRDPYPEANV